MLQVWVGARAEAGIVGEVCEEWRGGLSKRDLWLEFLEVLQASGPQLSLSNQRGCTRKAEGSRVGGGSPIFCFSSQA